MVAHVLQRCAEAFGQNAVVLVTSSEPGDDALASTVAALGYTVFRGELDDVVLRFQQCLHAHPCDWFVRISGDSPMIDPALMRDIAALRAPGLDLVSNVQVRSFPSGQSVEVLRAERFLAVDSRSLTPSEREHVTPHFYSHPEAFRIRSVVSTDPAMGKQRQVVDTPEDLEALRGVIESGNLPAYARMIAGAGA
jgi:spore coat polysaccharide biosynthesis protein SpsF